MTLNPPSVWQYYLLESPWLIAVGLVAIGAVLRLIARQQGRTRLAATWWVALAAAAAVVMLSRVVETPREQIMRHTRHLISLTEPIDADAVVSYLMPDAMIVGPGGESWMDVDQMRDVLETVAKRFPIDSQAIRRLDAENRGGEGLVLLDLRTTLSTGMGAQMPVPTRWLVTWRRSADGDWLVHRIKWLEMMGQPPSFGVWR
jgi:ketosteroid isomerase-like protein